MRWQHAPGRRAAHRRRPLRRAGAGWRNLAKLEKRFTKKEIQKMMQKAGLIDIKFSNKAPYYVVLGIKAN